MLIATATISGAVVAADGRHEPVRRVVVTMSGAELPLGRSAITDDEGRFSIEGLPAGRFSLSATKPAYVPAAYGASRPGRPGIAVALSEGQHLTGLTIAIAHGAAISGTIRNALGQPNPSIQVSVFRELPGADFSGVTAIATTNDRGQYRIFGLAPGDYIVATAPQYLESREVGVPSTSEVDALFAALEHRQRTASAPSTLPQRVPTANLSPVFYPGVLDVTQAAKVTVAAGDDRTGVDIALQFARTATVEGVIVSPVSPTPPVTLAMTLTGPAPPIIGSRPTPPAHIGDDGRFRFTNARPGTYVIQAETRNIYVADRVISADAGAAMWWARTEVTVNGEDLSGIALTLQPAMHLSGRVTFDATTLPLPADVTKIEISLLRFVNGWRPMSLGDPFAPSGVPPRAPPGVDGSFSISGIVPGSYTIAAAPIPAGWWLRSAIVNGKDVLDTPLDVGSSGEDVKGALLTFSDRNTILSGTLHAGATPESASYFIVVFPADRSLWHAPSRRIQSTRADTEGKFIVRDLPPGDYLIGALTDFDLDDLLESSFFEKLAAASATVTLGEGEQKTQDLRIGGGWPELR